MERTVDVWWSEEGFKLYKEYIGDNILRGMHAEGAMIEAVKDVAEKYHLVQMEGCQDKNPKPE